MADLDIERIKRELAPTVTASGHSYWSTVLACPRKAYLKYGLKVEPDKTPVHFLVGRLVHAALAYKFRGQLHDLELDGLNLIDWVAGNGLDDGQRMLDVAVLDEAHRLISYAQSEIELPGTLLGVEVLMKADFNAGVPVYTARADLLLSVDGRIAIGDYKTRSRARSGYQDDVITSLSVDGQFRGLSRLASQHSARAALIAGINGTELGPTPTAVGVENDREQVEPPMVYVIDILKTKEPDVVTWEVPFTWQDLDDWAEAQVALMRRYTSGGLSGTLGGYSGERHFDSCVDFRGWRCDYFDWCHGTPEQRTRNFRVPS